MPDVSSVPAWVWGAILAGLVVAGVGGYFLYRYIRHHVERRLIQGMVPKMQSIEASRKSLETVMTHLAEDSDDDLLAFAEDADSVDRLALAEVEQRMRLLRDELDHTPFPADVIPVAVALADAAHVIADEAGRVHAGMTPDDALAALAEIDLARTADQVVSASVVLKIACEEYNIEDVAVYGGGLYI